LKLQSLFTANRLDYFNGTTALNRFLHHLPYTLTFFLLMMLQTACTKDKFTGFSYDPEGAEVTTDKPIKQPKKRSFGITKKDLWITNEFRGSRLSDFYESDSGFVAVIAPERQPVNNSPWYAFKLWGSYENPFSLILRYKDGQHRYHPKISMDGSNWTPLDTKKITVDSTGTLLQLQLPQTKDSLWVAAQEIITPNHLDHWISNKLQSKQVAESGTISVDSVGASVLGKPIKRVIITGNQSVDKSKGVLIITSRQHPPEVPGDLAMRAFTQTFLSGDSLAQSFLKRFEVHLFPMLNPDGADRGHWRLNANGVDLNRDWEAFNQPETQAVRSALLDLKEQSDRRVFYHIDFHATDEHVLYPILPEIEKFPGNITERWLDQIEMEVPEYPFKAEPFDTTAPIAKNWMFKTFGADGVTFELYDETDRSVIQKLGKKSSRLLMQLLLDAYDKQLDLTVKEHSDGTSS